MYVGLVFLAYFGVCGVFCSVAGSWVVKSKLHRAGPGKTEQPSNSQMKRRVQLKDASEDIYWKAKHGRNYDGYDHEQSKLMRRIERQ